MRGIVFGSLLTYLSTLAVEATEAALSVLKEQVPVEDFDCLLQVRTVHLAQQKVKATPQVAAVGPLGDRKVSTATQSLHGRHGDLQQAQLATPMSLKGTARVGDETHKVLRHLGEERALGGNGAFIGILSKADNFKRRMVVRECMEKAKGIPYMFFVGRPNHPDGIHHTQQGSQATADEINVAGALRQEQQAHQDMHAVPVLEGYSVLTDKLSMMLDYALDAGYDMIFKFDDDQCPVVNVLQNIIADVYADLALYVGSFLWKYPNPSYWSVTQKGPDPRKPFVPYFAGPCYGLSRELASIVIRSRSFDTFNYFGYGTDSEDNNMGRWFDRAVEAQRQGAYDGVRFKLQLQSGMCVPV